MEFESEYDKKANEFMRKMLIKYPVLHYYCDASITFKKEGTYDPLDYLEMLYIKYEDVPWLKNVSAMTNVYHVWGKCVYSGSGVEQWKPYKYAGKVKAKQLNEYRGESSMDFEKEEKELDQFMATIEKAKLMEKECFATVRKKQIKEDFE